MKDEMTVEEGRHLIAQLARVINRVDGDGYLHPVAVAVRDIIAAWRGPDAYAFKKKFNTTAVIRSLSGINEQSGLMVNPDVGPESVEKYLSNLPTDEDLKFNSGHFESHITRALSGLEVLGLTPPRKPS